MKTRLITLLTIFISSSQLAFNQDDSKNTLITIDDQQISKEEFVRIYKKNNQNTIDQKSIEEYLDLFINFKLKVIEAENRGLDTLESFNKELSGYRRQLAKKYFTNTELEEKLVKEAYDRMHTAVRTSHILIHLANNASPSDTLIAYNKAMDVRKRLLNGEDFGTVALEVSDDKNVKYNFGDIGYISSFKRSYPYENTAFNLKKGEISMPIRTLSGYHIIKKTGEIEVPGKMRVAHIALPLKQNASVLNVNTIQNDIELMYDTIKNGADFSAMASQYSIDRQSAANGGELPKFEPGTFVPEFEELCFNMKEPGEIAGPVKTYFGWHLIKLIEIEPIQPYDDIKGYITKRIKQDPDRKKIIDQSILKRIKKENGFEVYSSNLEPFYSMVDSATYTGTWDKSKADGFNDVLFSIGVGDFTQQDFNDYIARNIKTTMPKGSEITIINNFFEGAIKQSLLEYENFNLEEKFPDFRNLMKEYHDGILLFELTDQLVWTKAIKDTVGLEAFYNNNKEKYMWEKRAYADIYICDNDEYANAAMKIAPKKMKKGYTNEEIIEKICDEDNKDCIKIETGKFEKNDNKFIDEAGWEIGLTDIVSKDDKQVFANIYEILEPEQKLFAEAKGIVTADYQDLLEKKWISELRNKYKITVNKELLKTIK